MTIFEIAHYIPLGSTIALQEWDERRMRPNPSRNHTGILVELQYDSGHNHHRIGLKNADGIVYYSAKDIALIHILKQPADMGCNSNGTTIEQAAQIMYETTAKYMQYVDPKKRATLSLALSLDFADGVERICAALDRANLPVAEQLIRSWKKLPSDQWDALFVQLRDTRLQAQHNCSEDLPWIRRAEAYICCCARKENLVIYDMEGKDPLAYAIGLLIDNLVQEGATVLPPEDYGTVFNQDAQALDWFLLALCYHRSGMHSSCAYSALVQSILHLGRCFHDPKNYQMFNQLCGNAHDFTLLRHILTHMRRSDPAQEVEYLQALGHTMCWMLYQMGGSGILDADELLACVKSIAVENAGDLRERMLAFSMKYSARNRNDRFLAITTSMQKLLIDIQTQKIPPADGVLYGYIYDFNGVSSMPVSEYSGFIMGQDFLSYRFSYPAETASTLPMQLQALSANAREFGTHTLPAVWFSACPSGKLYRYQADNRLELVNGGYMEP